MSSPENGVLEIADPENGSVKILIDEKTGLPAKEVYESAQPMGQTAHMEEIFEDFEETGGLKLPKKITVNQNGSKFAEVNITGRKLNSGVKAEDLSKKP